MADCRFKTDRHPLVCRECGRPLPERFAAPVRRNCPAAEPRTDADVLADMLASLSIQAKTDRPAPVLVGLIRRCQAGDCGRYQSGQGCTRGPCGQRWGVWRDTLATGWCERWDDED